jgi:succinate-semialdehyde dehydrogenase / glutarate-semialdehyde dehydrogenase
MLLNDVPPAVPLWINGHAFLTVTEAFLDVRDSLCGKVLRRTPLCGIEEVRMAIAAAQAALASWAGMSRDSRAALLAALGDALAGYRGHFARLISEESRKELSLAVAEVSDAAALLRSATISKESGVVVVIGSSGVPLLDSLRQAVPALAAGATVVIRPSAEMPSALYALAELTRCCGFPDGAFNIVYCGEVVVDALRVDSEVSLLFS